MNQIYLIDGTNQFYRFFYAPFRNLDTLCPDCNGTGNCGDCRTCEGTGREQTKATYLFTKEILRIIREKKPKYLAVAFDGKRDNLKRTKLYPAYKQNRSSERPEGVTPQLRRIKQILNALQITTINCKTYEADDAIATLATKYAKKLEVIIVSSDKDLSQLCNSENVFIYDPIKQSYSAKKTAGAKFGIRTDQLLDYFTLTGDVADNVRGIKGWGPKTAQKYLNQYLDLDAIIAHARHGVLPAKLAKNLLDAVENGQIKLNQQILKLDSEIENLPKLSDMRISNFDIINARALFRVLNFRNME